MTKLEALKDLAAKVKAGETTRARVECIVLHALVSSDDNLQLASYAEDAYSGSLDAAKALHEAVLPDADFEIARGRSGARARVYPMPQGGMYEAGDYNPARAWLLAILRALISQEESK